jgi:hypothetical protein
LAAQPSAASSATRSTLNIGELPGDAAIFAAPENSVGRAACRRMSPVSLIKNEQLEIIDQINIFKVYQ